MSSVASEGRQTPQYKNRQQAARTVSHNLADEKVAAGTRTVHAFWNGRWWHWWTKGTPGEETSLDLLGWDCSFRLYDFVNNEGFENALDRLAFMEDRHARPDLPASLFSSI